MVGRLFHEGSPMEQPELKAQIMDEQAMSRALTRVAHEIIEKNEGADGVALVGIVRRGAAIAPLLADEIAKIEGSRPPVGSLDVSFYRDDVRRKIAPVEFGTDIPFAVDDRDIVLVDDDDSPLMKRTLKPQDYLSDPIGTESIAPGRSMSVRFSLQTNVTPARCVVTPVFSEQNK